MHLYSLLQHYKNWKPNNTHSIFSLKKWEPDNTHSTFSFTNKWEPDNTHNNFSITKFRSQTIHTASSASPKMGARQYTQHLQLHKKMVIHTASSASHTHTKKKKKMGARQYTQHLPLLS